MASVFKSRLTWVVAVAGMALVAVLWYVTARRTPDLQGPPAQPADDGPAAQQAPPDVSIDYARHRVIRQDAAGRVQWSTPVEGELNYVRPPDLLGDADRVYVAHGDGVSALDYGSGAVLWHSAGPNQCMLLSGDLLLATDCTTTDYLPKSGRMLVAWAAATGQEVFKAPLPAKDFDPQPIRKVAGFFLVQVTEAPGGEGAAFLFDRRGRLRQRLDREVVDGRAMGEDLVLLTSRDVVRLGPDDKQKWAAPFRIPEWIAGGGIVDLPDGDVLGFLYGEISDSGVQVMRLHLDGTVVWQAFCAPLGVCHSKYNHHATVAIEAGQVEVNSHGSFGTFVETLDAQSGRQMRRTQHE